MKNSFRQSMAWLHTWSGLLLSWVLFAIFVTGTASYYRHEITRWMMPELAGSGVRVDETTAIQNSLALLEKQAKEVPTWFMTLPDQRLGVSSVSWWGGGAQGNAYVDPANGQELKVRETRGGEFFYRFHFQLQLPYPSGRYLVGVAAMFMFVALISGIVTHRQFFKEFFTFRSGRAWLRSCMDLHNVTAVLALPFYLMISFSALLIFMKMYLPWGDMVTKDLPKPVAAAVSETSAPTAPSHPASIESILAKMKSEQTEASSIRRVQLKNRNTDTAEIVFYQQPENGIIAGRYDPLRYSLVTGEKLPSEAAPLDGIVGRIHGLFYGLHLAHFAPSFMRASFFILGAMGAVMTATGMLMWTKKRKVKQDRQNRPSFGYFLVDHLNIAGITGLLIACAAIFWANRLLPVEIAERELLEVKIFLYAWAASLVHAFIRSSASAWKEQLWFAALLYLGIPFLDGITASQWVKSSIASGNLLFPVFDLVMASFGILFAYAALKLKRMNSSSPSTPSA